MMKKKALFICMLMSICSFIKVNAQDYSYKWNGSSLYFTNGTANLVSYIDFGDISISGYMEVTLSGSFSHQNTNGTYSKRYAIGRNAGNAVYSSSSEVSAAFGPVATQWKLGEFEINGANHLILPIYHLVSTGNSIIVSVNGLSTASIDTSLIQISAPQVIANNQTRDYVYFNDRVGIGTNSPKAVLDIAKYIPNQTLGAVLGRLIEGDETGNGTFVGVQGHSTDIIGGKSFSLVHNFYGLANSAINFHRGGDRTGGFISFTTNSDIERMRIDPNGNVGIGTVDPQTKLQIEGNAANGNIGTEEIFKIGRKLTEGVSFQQAAAFRLGRWSAPGGAYESNTRLDITLKGNSPSSNYDADVTVMTLQNNGNVGIGTATPNEKLAVNGKIRAKEIKVETANWPDYVFEEGYKVGTLEELEGYIKTNKRLPEMPGAKEAEANGVELGEMNKLLLKKQEELTLYLIEQNKQIQQLLKEVKELKEQHKNNKK